MSAAAGDAEDTALEWSQSGENDWCATAPGGAMALYAGPRFALVDPGPSASLNQRLSLHIDLSFVHRLTLARQGRTFGVLSREGAIDRLAKAIGYTAEGQTGDADFDRRVYVALDDPQVAGAMLARPEARRLVLALFERGVTRIVAKPRDLEVHMAYAPSPALDGGQALSAIATRLDALADLWPRAADGERLHRLGTRINRRVLAFAWAGAGIAAVLAAAYFGAEDEARQIERFARPDGIGLAALLAAIVLPSAVLTARRADAHRTLGKVALAALLVLPFSGTFRVVEINRLAARAERSAPAEILAATDPDAGPEDVLVETAGHRMRGRLSPDQAELAREGRLCAEAVTVEGLRGLRYVADLRVWACRPAGPVTELGPQARPSVEIPAP